MLGSPKREDTHCEGQCKGDDDVGIGLAPLQKEAEGGRSGHQLSGHGKRSSVSPGDLQGAGLTLEAGQV